MSHRRTVSTEVKVQLGKRIGVAREKRGYATRALFAEHLGVREETYNRYERGEVIPDVELLAAIADLTGYTLDWLIAGVGKPKRENKRARG